MLFPFFNKENVAKIEIIAAFGLTTTILVKQNDQWLVESMDNYPADQTAVKELLDKVAEMKTIQRASSVTRRSKLSFRSIAPASRQNSPTQVAISSRTSLQARQPRKSLTAMSVLQIPTMSTSFRAI